MFTVGTPPARRALAPALALLAAAWCASACTPLLMALTALRRAQQPARTLALAVPAEGNTQERGDDRLRATCRGTRPGDPEGATEHVYRFVAPSTQRYRFTASGEFDTVLAVYRDDHELACNDDAEQGAGLDSRLTVLLQSGASYLVVVDGYRGDRGRYRLMASAVAPGERDEPASPTRRLAEDPIAAGERCRDARDLPEGLSTGLFSPGMGAMASCGGSGSGVVYRVRAARRGTLTVRQVSPWPAAMELRAGCGPERAVLACSAQDRAHAGVDLRVEIAPGEMYLVLDSQTGRHRGPFALDVRFEPEAPAGAAAVSAPVDRQDRGGPGPPRERP